VLETGAYAGDNAGDGMGRWEHVEGGGMINLHSAEGFEACECEIRLGSTY
jgi:hypothetical protein